MSEIDSLGSNVYYAGVQNATNEALRQRKAEKADKAKKTSFGDILKTTKEAESEFIARGLPPEIQNMTFDEAAVFLKDAVDMAGDALSAEVSTENIEKFKKAVGQFLTFIVDNNFEVTSKKPKRMKIISPVGYFSTYNTKGRLADPKVQINIINQKLNQLTQATLENQKDNLKILQQIGEIKGLIVDLMSS